MSKDDPLGWKEAEMLNALGDGADVWERPAAEVCRALEKRGLVSIAKPKDAPKSGAERQPYFGAKPNAKAKRLAAEYFLRELGVKRWPS